MLVGMASKLALVAFLVLLALARIGASWLGSASTGGFPAEGSLIADHFEGPSVQLGSMAARRDHLVWNAACWLFGLGLAASLRRRGAAQPAVD